jgi:hypothetical protein
MRERERPELPLPRGRLERALLAVGTAAMGAAMIRILDGIR